MGVAIIVPDEAKLLGDNLTFHKLYLQREARIPLMIFIGRDMRRSTNPGMEVIIKKLATKAMAIDSDNKLQPAVTEQLADLLG